MIRGRSICVVVSLFDMQASCLESRKVGLPPLIAGYKSIPNLNNTLATNGKVNKFIERVSLAAILPISISVSQISLMSGGSKMKHASVCACLAS